jgi:PPK2 family polyphosphate:nucleotide phosphotransferase
VKINSKRFRVREGQSVNLKEWPTRIKPFFSSKEQVQQTREKNIEKLRSQQDLLFATDRYALLVIFQALDAAGKDSAIKHVMSGLNPQGVQVYSFKHPSLEELDHDFLWRAVRVFPERGRIGIFNRSYYEEVLVVRVHPEFLRAENLPEDLADKKKIWDHRFRSIRDMERHLHVNGTRVVKFYLHLSKEEQRKRFLKRIDDPTKNWKFSPTDLNERRYWKQYRKVFEECLSATSTEIAPWYVVPADEKPTAQLIISRVVVETLEDLGLSYPVPDAVRRKELRAIRKILARGNG